VSVLATLIVPLAHADNRLEPVVLGAVSVLLSTALGVLGTRRLVQGAVLAAVLGASLLPSLAADEAWLQRVDLAAVLSVAALGVVVVTGWGGQPFLAPLAVGGASGAVVEGTVHLGQPAITGVCCAMACAIGVGPLLGALCARRSDAAVAVITLGVAGLVDAVVLRGAGARPLPGHAPGSAARHGLTIALLVAALLSVAAMRRGGLRLALVAGRAGAAAAVRGVEVRFARVAAWTAATALAGASGCAFVLDRGGVTAPPLGAAASLRLTAVVMLTGASRSSAAIVAGAACGLVAGDDGAAPRWLDLVVGTSVVVAVLARERWRAEHKPSLAIIGRSAGRMLRPVTPSQEHATGLGLMSGDVESGASIR
jgi:ABC-type branched-subunit amino acid transport system permease subunit